MLNHVVFVGDPCCDHSASSGYHQVCALFPDAGWLSERALVEGTLIWHRRPSDSADPERILFHVLYGDFSAAPTLLRKRFPASVIASTIHRPIGRVHASAAGRTGLNSPDVLFTVARVQAEELERMGTHRSVHTVPHGVWTGPFRPITDYRGPRDRILLVGNHLRDWPMATRVLDRLARAGIRSVVVGAQDRIERLRGNPAVDVLERVSEPDLARLYDRAAAVLLPVREATASNALLEGMAAGCPVVCPMLPALVDEYIGDHVDAYEQGDVVMAVDRLLSYVADPDRRQTRSATLIERSSAFDWGRLEPRYQAAFEAIDGQMLFRRSGSAPGEKRVVGDPIA